MEGVRLILEHPQVAFRDCRDCLQYVYDETTGQRTIHRGKPLRRTGKPPCGFFGQYNGSACPKVKPGAAGKELSPRNRRAYEHYHECKATGDFPDDAIVRRNASLIALVEESLERQERRTESDALLSLLGALARRG